MNRGVEFVDGRKAGVMQKQEVKTVKQWYQEAQKVPAVIPLTRANTADLPANDSLVRASQEPAQAQEGVLLRAAAGEAQAEQEGQLLRASVGGE